MSKVCKLKILSFEKFRYERGASDRHNVLRHTRTEMIKSIDSLSSFRRGIELST